MLIYHLLGVTIYQLTHNLLVFERQQFPDILYLLPQNFLLFHLHVEPGVNCITSFEYSRFSFVISVKNLIMTPLFCSPANAS